MIKYQAILVLIALSICLSNCKIGVWIDDDYPTAVFQCMAGSGVSNIMLVVDSEVTE